MAYTFLDNSLNTIGVLTNKGGQTNDYWGDSITHEIATSQDVLTSVSLSVDKPSVNIDTSGNQKTWNHVIQGLSFNIDGIGRKVNENDYLIYQEGTNGKYYLMAITQVDESAVQSGFHYKTVQGLNAAAYDLSRKTLRAKSFAQIPDNTQEKGTAQNILRYIFKDINWDVRIIGSFGAIDYEIAEGTTAQAVLLDIIGMFEAEVDAYVQLNNWGKGANVFNKNGSIKRIFDFSTSLGKYRGETIRYDKNMVSITKTGARDSMYTKLYVNGNNITIADVNKGADFIVDDVANRKYNKLGSVSTPVTYLEGIITNSAIESPTALLAWGKKQLKILNHPRYNYQISATNDDKVQLGDTVIIQDTHASDPIYLKSKVISKTVSLADPVNNSFIVGEFSSIVIGADNGLDDTDQIMQLVNQANQTAVNAQKQADENTKKIADTRTDLEKNIDDRISEAKSYSDELTQTVANQVNSELAIVKSESDNLSAKTDQMIADANSYADTMYSNAVSFARTEASKALSDANTALDEAKSDLTDGIASEASARNQAVATVNSQAQSYANQAKSDAIEAAKTADGVVRKDFKATTDSLSSTITQNKEDADGKISTAQTTATQALNGLSTKVSQTDYDKKTGDLSTAVNTVTQTATETKNELAKVSKTVGSESAKINTISNTVDGTKQTISDIQTEQGKQSGSIATLQSRADGFDATVTKVNNLSVGGRNYILDTGNPKTQTSNGTDNQDLYDKAQFYDSIGKWGEALSDYIISFDWELKNALDTSMNGKIIFNKSPYQNVSYTIGANQLKGHAELRLNLWSSTVNSDATGVVFRIMSQMASGNTITYSNLFMKSGTIATDWSPAPEDVDSATAKAQLTADNATLAINNYKTDADGRIHKAQADITATANEVSTKVSQSDYDNKTGDLTTKYGQVKATADAVTTEVAKYKETNDKKVNTNTANITTLNNEIDSKVSQTVFDKTTGDLSGKYSVQQQTINGISQTVTELQAKVNAQGQINQLMNTEFNPDLEGWYFTTSGTIREPYRSYWQPDTQATTVGWATQSGSTSSYSRLRQDVQLSSTPGSGHQISMSWYAYTGQTDFYNNLWLTFYDKDNKSVGNTKYAWATTDGTNPSKQNSWNVQNKWEGIDVPDTAVMVNVSFEAREGTSAYLAHPMLVMGSTIGDYAPGNYNNNARVAALEVDLDHITGLVNDPKNGLSATATLAANGLSVATKAQTAATTADGKAVAAQKLATTANTTANGTQTTVTNVQKDVKDLQSTTTQTAGQVTTEIEDRKNGDKSVVTQVTNLIDQRITDTKKGYESAISQSADKIMASVSTPNQLLNTEFNPDLEGWTASADSGSNSPYRSYWQRNIQGTVVGFNTTSASTSTYAYLRQTVQLPSTPGSGYAVSMSWYAYSGQTDNYNNLWISFYNSAGTSVGTNVAKHWSDTNGSNPSRQNSWTAQNKWENITVPDTATYLVISFDAREGTNAYLGHPMLVFGSTIGDTYMPGSYSGMNTSTVLELFKDNWALGIADNAGRIISGINGDSSGLSIVGKKITVSGDTTFLGSNFMDGAVIKDASISSAKIDNLDVKKLTGEKSEFIKSSWKSAYGYVDIEFGQMSVMGNNGVTYFGDGYVHISAAHLSGSSVVLEDIGSFGSNRNVKHDNVDYLAINLNQWNTVNGYGGDGIAFNVSQSDGTYQSVLSWESQLSAGYLGWLRGWQFRDYATFQNNLFGPNREQIGIGNINAVPALSIGDPMTGIAGNNGNLYFYTKNGYISLDDLINNKTGRASFRRTGFWK